MKFLKYALITVVVLMVALAGIGFLLPSSVQVERSVVINASPEQVFNKLNDLQQFNEWSPWYGMDPKAQYSYEGPATGAGAKMIWKSEDPNVGAGSQEIVESTPYTLIRARLEFVGQGGADAEYRLKAVEQGTEVTWAFSTDFGNDVVGRWFGFLLFDQMIGADYEKGLNQLKATLEK
ncbi:SRPBCC family protein [Permianibacter aggregans]|uniref:Polyketide cyclase/dehydrase/lipid transport protein n=1 Tax=Permianibacter aggregans TaxID=1510150 RepID=A0A4R6UTS8_9GAMM|nr:SRPBCC family protein [Permianibacter aggregans]QGX39593.1 hypothetical protein E2H98_07980 [Permianibacter aggregans]TDQ49656.1 polyketide cyclase/dehydrase/lipid transport protein [Permianibacter aggregans]